ncbi:NAD(P)H-binding protein [Winogradskyella haliclonae]|uniref:Epimerase n=1 Tax=Winogradskyella haliclonae TaxID=2048558 RepID=A0ABQ2BVC6_9FLAO|nr:NAD(P)H-binding protein [Winogradskyella haliclonae]GGI56432.1 epimerase [Winogradskyella haliclonae]
MSIGKKNNTISIIGCGWLGLPLAKKLIENGFDIKGSTTSENKLKELDKLGITSFLIRLNETKIEGDIFEFLNNSETLIINIPPGLRRNPNKNHVLEIKQLVKFIEKSSIKNVLYISSTSVYNNDSKFPIITEKTKPNAISNSGKQLIEIENILKNNSVFNTTILRFAGLFDQDRHPGKILSGRKHILNPEAPVNLIHKNDCISIIAQLIEKDFWNEEFNACYPNHPTKEQYYKQYCQAHNLELPKYNREKVSTGKKIDASKLAQLLKYDYKTGL